MSQSSIIPSDLYEEFVNALCGKLLGEGVDRKVFDLPITGGYWCVKFETGFSSKLYQNIEEWTAWQAVKGTDLEKWFAPCNWISPNGKVLIMRRTEPMPKAQYPDKVPNFFTDMKFDNFGMLDGQFVAHDYGLNLIREKGLTKRMITAHWW